MDQVYLVHQDIRPGVQTRGDGVVQHVLETLLLSDHTVQEIRPVDMRCLPVEVSKDWRAQ